MPAALLVCSVTADAQYFGRNKVQYDTFQFQVLETTHFRIHHYPEERAAVERTARMAERWYARLSELLDHDLRGSQPLILYASHPHFQQTNVIESMIGEGTGGVTESLRRRVVMPLASGLGETEHVLGHELVHAFQYDILGASLAMPLWFVEGMAEYLSLGGQPLIEPTDELEVNVGPVLSPDGSRLAFVSSRPRLSIDLMLADAKTGEVRRKLTETATDPHFDSLQFIQSAGTWDPMGSTIARDVTSGQGPLDNITPASMRSNVFTVRRFWSTAFRELHRNVPSTSVMTAADNAVRSLRERRLSYEQRERNACPAIVAARASRRQTAHRHDARERGVPSKPREEVVPHDDCALGRYEIRGAALGGLGVSFDDQGTVPRIARQAGHGGVQAVSPVGCELLGPIRRAHEQACGVHPHFQRGAVLALERAGQIRVS